MQLVYSLDAISKISFAYYSFSLIRNFSGTSTLTTQVSTRVAFFRRQPGNGGYEHAGYLLTNPVLVNCVRFSVRQRKKEWAAVFSTGSTYLEAAASPMSAPISASSVFCDFSALFRKRPTRSRILLFLFLFFLSQSVAETRNVYCCCRMLFPRELCIASRNLSTKHVFTLGLFSELRGLSARWRVLDWSREYAKILF